MIVYRYRSAVTGRYVTPTYAKSHPKTTVRERVLSPKLNDFVKGRGR
jgi:hypothetical protein